MLSFHGSNRELLVLSTLWLWDYHVWMLTQRAKHGYPFSQPWAGPLGSLVMWSCQHAVCITCGNRVTELISEGAGKWLWSVQWIVTYAYPVTAEVESWWAVLRLNLLSSYNNKKEISTPSGKDYVKELRLLFYVLFLHIILWKPPTLATNVTY